MIYYPGTDIMVAMPLFSSRGPAVQFTWDVEGRDGYSLQCEASTPLAIEARLEGAVSWTNLETTPIDLTPYIGIRQAFEFRITPAAFTEDGRAEFVIFAGVS